MISIETLTALKDAVGAKGWSDDPHELAPHTCDWRGRWQGETPLLLKPATTEEAAACVRICAREGIAITPQGGNTGLVGGSIPRGEVLISLSRMKQVREIDTANDAITVEAGCILESIQNEAEKVDRLFPLSLGSQGSATIGGLISTNAGGVHVLRYGMMRDLVLGIEAILPDGRIWNGLRGLRKDNSGYDLKQVFIGAEGTLGLVTAATLKLFPKPAETSVAFAGIPSPAAAVDLLGLAKSASGGTLSALEIIPRNALDLVLQHIPDTRDPLDQTHPWYALLEIGAARVGEGRAAMEDALSSGFEAGLVTDAVIAESESQAHALWQLREPIAEAEKAHGKAAKHDVSIPVSKIAAFIVEATAASERLVEGANVIAFGHVGDGNVHFNVASQEAGAGDAFLERCQPATEAIYDLVQKYGGSIAAEHGVGTLKSDDLAERRPLEVELMRSIKSALDPKGIMNPRVLIPVAR
ncbi:FAD-binding oxidoreductase [Hyphobacterium sp.]|uniref:FAD-binding oxidoreductase n=1 Tax=Hyphobacterium sp. TaxID=2004662 RepID=UPI003BAA8315